MMIIFISLGTHAVMANGGIIANTGAHMVTICAEAHSVPVIVLTGIYKLTPLFPFDSTTFNELMAPLDVMKLVP